MSGIKSDQRTHWEHGNVGYRLRCTVPEKKPSLGITQQQEQRSERVLKRLVGRN